MTDRIEYREKQNGSHIERQRRGGDPQSVDTDAQRAWNRATVRRSAPRMDGIADPLPAAEFFTVAVTEERIDWTTLERLVKLIVVVAEPLLLLLVALLLALEVLLDVLVELCAETAAMRTRRARTRKLTIDLACMLA
jgi:hypothetical protein